MTIPARPLDFSGGYIEYEFSDGTHSHHHRHHIQEFNETTGAYVTPLGTEVHVWDTATAYLAKVRDLYSSAWTLLTRFYVHHLVAGDTFDVPIGLTTLPSATGAGAPVSDPAGIYVARQATFSMGLPTRTDRFKLIWLGFDQIGPQGAAYNTHAGSAIAALDAMRDYLTGANSMIVAHNGERPIGQARVTWCQNKKLRRRAGQL